MSQNKSFETFVNGWIREYGTVGALAAAIGMTPVGVLARRAPRANLGVEKYLRLAEGDRDEQ